MEAILQSPDDDALRLIFADWLEERGDPRGEFIRVQYALLDEKLDERKRFELKTREGELIAEHGRKWAGPIHEITRKYGFRRGMVSEVTVAPDALKDAEKLLENSPIQTVIMKADNWCPIPFLFWGPSLARIRELDLFGYGLGSHMGVEMLAGCPHLGGIEKLRLDLNQIGLHQARALATTTNLPALKHLSIRANPIGNLGFQAICASQTLNQLTCLDVEMCQISIDGLRGAAKDFRLSDLEELALGHNSVDRQGITVLARLPVARSLRTIRLNDSNLNAIAIRPLTDSPAFGGLKTLDLRNNLLTDTAAHNLANSSYLGGLQHLKLEGNKISREAREKLKARFGAAVTF